MSAKILTQELAKEALEGSIPSAERCADIVAQLVSARDEISFELLQETKLGKVLTKSIKSFKREKRTADENETTIWEKALKDAESLLEDLKAMAQKEDAAATASAKKKAAEAANASGLPKTATAYKTRLEKHNKEIYKSPPVLPPDSIKIESKTYGLPKRDKTSGKLTFSGGCSKVKDFTPNRTPEEVLRAGSFGGTYFRPIVSAVTNVSYKADDVLKDSVEDSWIEGLDKRTMLISTTYRKQVNKYGVKCGGSLGMWESSGWISDSDPYGWFQWYCRFYQGRRCSDDERQISRWLKSAGEKGRFRSQICNKILAANTSHDDASISPVIRQTLLHWGLEITPEVLEQHRKRVGA